MSEPNEHHNRESRPQSRLVIFGLAAVAISTLTIYTVLAYVSGSSSATSSDLQVKVLDSSKSNARMNGVYVTIKGIESGTGCASSLTARSGPMKSVLTRVPEDGLALFKDCNTGANRLHYNIVAASYPGYKRNSKTPHFGNKGAFTLFASKSSKKRNKIVTLYMSPDPTSGGGSNGGSVTPPPPPPPTGSLPASPNSNLPIPCGTAFSGNSLSKLSFGVAYDSIARPSECKSKEVNYVS